MLQAAARRGVRVNIIVYKVRRFLSAFFKGKANFFFRRSPKPSRVVSFLILGTRPLLITDIFIEYLSPTLPEYLHSIFPRSTDAVTSLLVKMGLAATLASIEQMEVDYPLISPPITVNSSHTKRALENLHPNISVFRHPDHLLDAQTLQSSIVSSLENLSLNAATVTKLPVDAVKSLYGMNDDVILYWAHHEKLCLVDGRIAFMGGLDLCFGRWDTNQHPLADAHPSNLDDIVFPGQDYNNARIMDFQEVNHWQNNKLDRKQSSRMGWSDISISLKGPVVQDLQEHFVERWNFIYDEKYNVRRDQRYSRLTFTPTSFGIMPFQGSTQSLAPQQDPYGRPSSSQGRPPSQQSYQNPTYGPQSQSQTTPQPYEQQFAPPPTSHSAMTQPYGQQFPPPPTAASPQPQGQAGVQPYGQQLPPPPTAASPQPQGQTGSQPNSQQFPPPPSGGAPPASQQPYGGGYSGQSLPPPPPGSPPASTHQSQYYSSAGNLPQYGQSPSNPAQSSYVELEGSLPTQTGQNQSQYHAPLPQQTRGIDDDLAYEGERGAESESERGFGSERERLKSEARGITNMLRGRLGEQVQQAQGHIQGGGSYHGPHSSHAEGPMSCQIVRSCTKWSHGTATEHSIQDAYIKVIQESQHFVYIENQFFITATGNEQKPFKNQIGAAIVERVLRAARAGEKYKVIVVIPAIPGFAGDLKDESSLGTRAIMEFQYNSINRGGHSIMECIGRAGYNPMEYIRFYNLRNYDRINAGGYMQQVQQRSGVDYEDARRQHDDMVGAGYGGTGERTGAAPYNPGQQYQQYQQAAQALKPSGSGRWDTVSECYMLGGQDIRSVPWEAGELSEIEAFVSEELYIHTKVRHALDAGTRHSNSDISIRS
jgi:phospholipase D1/2